MLRSMTSPCSMRLNRSSSFIGVEPVMDSLRAFSLRSPATWRARRSSATQ